MAKARAVEVSPGFYRVTRCGRSVGEESALAAMRRLLPDVPAAEWDVGRGGNNHSTLVTRKSLFDVDEVKSI